MRQCEIHKAGINAHNKRRYFYGVDYETKQQLFEANTEKMAIMRARLRGYKTNEICLMY